MIKKIIKELAGIGDRIYNKGIFLWRKPKFEKFPKINGKIYMVASRGAISFGNEVTINSNLKSNPIGGSTRTILFAEPDAKISIGNNVGISNSAIHAAQAVIIEDDVMIGGDCRIYDTDFHSIIYDKRMEKPDTGVKQSSVLIKKGAFIGTKSMILKGVQIGEKSVVAAGSVVTKSIPPNELWGGVPARFIRRIEEDN